MAGVNPLTRMMKSLAPNSITAAVRELEIGVPKIGSQMGNPSQGWQEEAWNRYDDVGELRFVCQWIQNSCSQVTLYAAQLDAKSQPASPSENPVAQEIVAGIAGGPAGQSELMAQAVTPLTVAGEFHIAILQEDGEEVWHVVPSDKVRRDSRGNISVIIRGEEREVDEETESVFQVYRQHPRDDMKSDSAVRAALPILREIRAMDMLIQSASRSRLAGNGLLLIPKEVNNASAYAPPGGSVPGVPDATKPPLTMARKVTRTLVESMTQSLEHVGEPEALTPVTMAVPGEQIAQFRHMQFSQDVSERHENTREKALGRLAKALDVPAEILTGLGDSTHWNADIVDSQASRQHLAPLLTVICDALTKVVLHPLLEKAGLDPNGVVVWFDMSPLTEKRDKTAEAQAAFDAGVLSREAYLRELGFSDTDLRDEDAAVVAMRMMERAPSLYVYLWSLVPGFPPPNQEASDLMRALEGKTQEKEEVIVDEADQHSPR